jgi:hypothetical protein
MEECVDGTGDGARSRLGKKVGVVGVVAGVDAEEPEDVAYR